MNENFAPIKKMVHQPESVMPLPNVIKRAEKAKDATVVKQFCFDGAPLAAF